MDRDWKLVKDSLSHVYWIGGGPAAGKSTISKRLASEFGFTLYDGDQHWFEHLETATPDANPVGHRLHLTRERGESFNWFFGRTGEEIAKDELEMARIDFDHAVDDLSRLPDDAPVIVDAFLGFPELVFRVADSDRAVFLIATDEFQKEIWDRRTTEGDSLFRDRFTQVMNSCMDSEAALNSHIDSHSVKKSFMADDCERRGATLMVTGGSIDLEEAYAAVKKHFHLNG